MYIYIYISHIYVCYIDLPTLTHVNSQLSLNFDLFRMKPNGHLLNVGLFRDVFDGHLSQLVAAVAAVASSQLPTGGACNWPEPTVTLLCIT